MIAYFARHKTAANLLMLTFLLLGVVGLRALQRETFPEFLPDKVIVTVAYPGASPQEVDAAIVQRIEDAVESVEFVAKIKSTAKEGLGTVTLEMEDGGDIGEFKADIDSAIDSITDFPADAEDPVTAEPAGATAVASIAVTGPMSTSDLLLYCDQLKRELKRYEEVSQVEIQGFSTPQVQIRIKQSAAAQYGLSLGEIADLVEAQSVDLPAGSLETEQGEIRIRFAQQRRSLEEFRSLPIVGGQRGAEVTLGELAQVSYAFEDDEEQVLFNGQRAGVLKVTKASAQDALDILAAVQEFVEFKSATAPPDVALTVTDDAASAIAERLELLTSNGVQGLVLVFVTLWLFFNTRLAMWVAAGLPVSFMGGLWVMSQIGYTLNMMTMMALLLALGLLMDDGIVLADNIAAHLRRGKTSYQAAIDGVSEVWPGIVSSFLTTICVFAPLTMLDGQIGRVLLVIPVVLIAVLSVSLVEAFAILPSHVAHSLHGRDIEDKNAFRRGFDQRFDWFRESVIGKLSDLAVRFRYVTVGITIAVFMVSFGLLAGGTLKFEGFPATDGDSVEFRLRMPAGTSLATTTAEVDRVVAALQRVNTELSPEQPEGQALVNNVTVRFNNNPDSPDTGPHIATIAADLLSVEVRTTTLDEIKAAWREQLGPQSDATSASFTSAQLGPGGAPIELRVQGQDLAELSAAASEVEAWMAAFNGTFDLATDLQAGTPQMHVRLRPGVLGASAQGVQVARQLRSAFSGDRAQDVRIGAEDYEVTVKLAQSGRDALSDLEYFELELGGERVPLGTIADIDIERTYAAVSRVDGVRTVTVTGDIDTAVANATELMTRFSDEFLPELKKTYPGLTFDVGGQTEESAKTATSMLTAFGIGLFGVFSLLSFQFRSYLEPFVVLGAIPLALIGVLWGNLLMGDPLTLPGILGFISLAGVVVNDSILLMLFIKNGLREGKSAAQAAAEASRSRFRAILLTSATTVAGLVPLMFERSQQAQTLIPVATSIVFGMLASTVLLLMVLPAMYTILADFGLTATMEDINDAQTGHDPH